MLLTYKHAASSLGVTERTIKNWVRAQCFPVVRLSARTVRIRQDDLDRFIESRCNFNDKKHVN
jgi:excisionase family DNA binding protein